MRRTRSTPGETPAAIPQPAPSAQDPPQQPLAIKSQGRFSRAIRKAQAGPVESDGQIETESAIVTAHLADPAARPAAVLLRGILELRDTRDSLADKTLPPASCLPLLF